MSVAEELIVALKSEGAGETRADIAGVEQQVDSATESMEDNAGVLESFSRRIQGVMKAVLAGIAVAVGGILTQVPVLGEVAAGLGAIVDSIALKLDARLRPALSGFVDDLFELSAAIAKGDWGRVKEIFAGWAQAITGFDFAGAFGTLVNKVSDLVVQLLGRLEGVDLRAVINDLLDGIRSALAQANIGKNFRRIISALGDFLKSQEWAGIAVDLLNFFEKGIEAAYENIKWGTWYDFIVDGLKGWIEDVDWSAVARMLLSALAGAITALASVLVDAVTSAVDTAVDSAIDSAKNKLANMAGVDLDTGSVDASESSIGTSGGLATGGGDTQLRIDGRRIDSQTGRFGKDRLNRRGL